MDNTSGFTGTDWSRSMLRAGCQDHMRHPSRRGDRLVAHQSPISMLSAAPRGTGGPITKASAKKGIAKATGGAA